MRNTYKVLILLIFIFAAGHVFYTFLNVEGRSSNEEQMWFLSGGLAMFLSGLINLLHFSVDSRVVRSIHLVANIAMLLFLVVLSVVVPEVQVIVLTGIMLLTVIVGGRYSPSAE